MTRQILGIVVLLDTVRVFRTVRVWYIPYAYTRTVQPYAYGMAICTIWVSTIFSLFSYILTQYCLIFALDLYFHCSTPYAVFCRVMFLHSLCGLSQSPDEQTLHRFALETGITVIYVVHVLVYNIPTYSYIVTQKLIYMQDRTRAWSCKKISHQRVTRMRLYWEILLQSVELNITVSGEFWHILVLNMAWQISASYDNERSKTKVFWVSSGTAG